MYLDIENISAINQYASKCSRERGKKPLLTLLLYMSKMVAGLMILFSTENHNFDFLLSAGLTTTSALIICSRVTRKNIPLLSYNVCVRIIDPSTKSGVFGHYLRNRMPVNMSSENTAIFKMSK